MVVAVRHTRHALFPDLHLREPLVDLPDHFRILHRDIRPLAHDIIEHVALHRDIPRRHISLQPRKSRVVVKIQNGILRNGSCPVPGSGPFPGIHASRTRPGSIRCPCRTRRSGLLKPAGRHHTCQNQRRKYRHRRSPCISFSQKSHSDLLCHDPI